MKSETQDIQQIFQDRRQYRVPFYQRAYVWDKEEQWDPLWNDIRDKADLRVNSDTTTPHFLGAIVLEPQPRRGLRGVEAYHIIDGQQRLTTLQYFLAALAMTLRANDVAALQTVIDGCLWNPNTDTMEKPEIECFKVWPTFRDREPYQEALKAMNRDELRSSFAVSFTQSGTLKKIGVDHPAALEAIWFFADQIDEWLSLFAGSERERALEHLAEATLRDFRVVAISLEENDDAQVIFETLNGRGAELNATDLIRNFIFMRADREDVDAGNLYDTLWTPFEGQFWIEEQRRGRLRKPRLEWFVQTALQAEMADTVEIGRLYNNYRRYGIGGRAPIPAETQLRMLTLHADQYRELISGNGNNPIGRFGRRMAVWDASPTHSLAIRVASLGLPEAAQTSIYNDIVSFIVRRTVCGLTTKNYNNVFLQLLKKFKGDEATASGFHTSLAALDGQASRWPRDDEFRRAWLNEPAHRNFGDVSRVRAVLTELENAMRTLRTEEPFTPTLGTLDVDHILPDKWYDHWPLRGETVTADEASNALLSSLGMSTPTARTERILLRERLKATLGNLTMVHYGVNRSLQNGPFPQKRERFFVESNLHLNRTLMRAENWDEEDIQKRGNALFETARTIWQSP
ncbi:MULTISPECIES: DUF262 domain-containing protein [Rhodopseudomonas]|uniref:DUF262 domain-containing protein n=1 Tax=Rhodopseudomonas palustris TaxID=1076 RepID=A0A0D7DY88_RHOPL|nr:MULTISPECIES: DUF262 domain-containing protein [Rhodopseudomonas]KIZ33563.1 hypothetical protein OO17_28280 [Rhodopseudomonas palustris]MDF3812742.1 DUF262 domain-containing HNH endonuclease family protein [Rhodopseudomonas sp. BAL398]WOK17573.1 DUF262 domain-containing HNH endonuclease family protein [Rhodopseudomonas sp. BAL398]